MKKILRLASRLALLLIAVFAAAGISNLVQDKPIVMAPESQTGKTPAFAKARKVLETNCLNCHSSQAVMPWYANLPLVKQLIESDIREGRHHMDMEKRVFAPGKTPTVKTLKEIAKEVRKDHMPPLIYKAVHWRAFLSAEDKAAIQEWVDEELAAADAAVIPAPASPARS